MQPSSALPDLPFRKVPRRGQQGVFRRLGGKKLNIQLPTGYGKTFTNVGSYSILKQAGRVNRLLVIFPTDAQLKQFVEDGPGDLTDACVDGPREICDLRYFGTQGLVKHRNNTCQVFAITAQTMIRAKGSDLLGQLLQSGRWMITVDEYHHYGINAAWGKMVLALACEFLLAMSATPHRKDDDSAFGPPDYIVTYRTAVEELAVKPLVGHAYVYRIDSVNENGDIRTYTTDELIREVGSNAPEAIEKHRITRKMRWSPKYISPLITVPIERMLRDRISTGYRLQALVGAMCVSHAQLACEQIQAVFPDLKTDWVGTGENGRPDADIDRIIKLFCPPKNERGHRKPELDVLVHVGIAGEGLDSVHVSEVIHLNRASINNSNNQENGRAARFLAGVEGHISFDSATEYAKEGYIGSKIMDAMDGSPPEKDDDDEGSGKPREPGLLPVEPAIQIWNMQLEGINSGDPEVVLYKKWVVKEGICGFTEEDLTNPASRLHELAVAGYRNMRRLEAEQHNTQAIVEQWVESVRNATSVVTGIVVQIMRANGQSVEKSFIGDIKRRINTRKKRAVGELAKDVEVCKKHYAWLRNLERELRESKEAPKWLA